MNIKNFKLTAHRLHNIGKGLYGTAIVFGIEGKAGMTAVSFLLGLFFILFAIKDMKGDSFVLDYLCVFLDDMVVVSWVAAIVFLIGSNFTFFLVATGLAFFFSWVSRFFPMVGFRG